MMSVLNALALLPGASALACYPLTEWPSMPMLLSLTNFVALTEETNWFLCMRMLLW